MNACLFDWMKLRAKKRLPGMVEGSSSLTNRSMNDLMPSRVPVTFTYQNEYYVTRNQIAAYESHEIDDICDYLTVHEVLELPYTARSEYVLYRWNDVFDNAEKIRSMIDRLRFQVECFNEALPYEAGQSYGDRAASQVRVIYRIS